MTWLARLKKLECTPAPALQNLQKAETGSFVGFVGTAPGSFYKSTLENDNDIARLMLFIDRDLSTADAETMVGRLEQRDLERDGRYLCLECLHLSGFINARRCSQWHALGIHRPAIPADLAKILQRCSGLNSTMEAKL